MARLVKKECNISVSSLVAQIKKDKVTDVIFERCTFDQEERVGKICQAVKNATFDCCSLGARGWKSIGEGLVGSQLEGLKLKGKQQSGFYIDILLSYLSQSSLDELILQGFEYLKLPNFAYRVMNSPITSLKIEGTWFSEQAFTELEMLLATDRLKKFRFCSYADSTPDKSLRGFRLMKAIRPSLRSFMISKIPFVDLKDTIPILEKTNIEELEISNAGLLQGLYEFGAYIGRKPRFKVLDFHGNKIDVVCMAMFLEEIKCHPRLQVPNLKDNLLSQRTIDIINTRFKLLHSEKAKLFTILMVSKKVPRVGHKSKLNSLPVDLFRLLWDFFEA